MLDGVLIPLLLLAGGIFILWISADALVRGAVILGKRAGISTIVIGLTVVSFGTSAPEFVVSVLAALRGSPDLAVGNVMGSNLANIGLVLGIAALMRPLKIAGRVVRREVPWMLAVTLLILPLLWNLSMGRVEGFILASVLFLYLHFLVRLARSGDAIPPLVAVESHIAAADVAAKDPGVRKRKGRKREAAGWGPALGIRAYLLPVSLVVLGSAGLVAGGQAIVAAASTLAAAFGISEIIVGLSVVAVGTSLPELATTIVAAVRREADLAVGNIVGSNIFNFTFVLGGTALIHPIAVDPAALRVEYPAVLILSLFLLPLAWTDRSLDRLEGLLLLALYGGTWVWIFFARGFG